MSQFSDELIALEEMQTNCLTESCYHRIVTFDSVTNQKREVIGK